MRPYLLLALLIPPFILSAQTVEDVITGLNTPSGLDIHDNVLYVTQEDAKSISKIDLSSASPMLEEVIALSGAGSPFILVNDGTYLYYSNFEEGYIARIEMGVANPVPEPVLENLTQPAGLLIDGNTLYFGHDADKVSKINLAESSPAIVNVASGLSYPANLALSGNDLFVAEFNGHKISRIDISATTPSPEDFLIGLSNPGQFALSGNELYFGEFSSGKISKVNLTAAIPTAEVVADNLQNPTGLAINGATLYFCQLGAGKISKVEGVVTGTNEINKRSIRAYPSPVSDYLIVDNASKADSARIFNVMGQLAKTLRLSSGSNRINVKGLTDGVYYLVIEPGFSVKFVKGND